MSKIISLLVLGFIGFYWWKTQQLKAFALQLAARRCKEAGVQLLDETVVQTKVRMKRDRSGRLGLERQYRFDFTSTGEHRYHGRVILRNGLHISTELEPFSIN